MIAGNFKSFVLNPLMEIFLVFFFFVSGYFYRPNKTSIWKNIWKRSKAVLIPFLVISIIFWSIGTIYLVATNQAPFIECLACLRNFFAGCIWNRDIQGWFNLEYFSLGKRYLYLADFWFLIAMFFSNIIFFLIADKVLKKIPFTLLVIVILFTLTGICAGYKYTLPYNLHLVPYWTAFMLLGAFVGNHKLIELPELPRVPKYTLGIVLLCAGITIAMIKTPALNQFRGTFDGDNQVISMVLCIAAAVPFILGICMIFHQLELDGLRLKEIGWVGSHSLVYYLFHMFYAWLISITFNFSLLTMDKWWLALIVILSTILICTLHSLLKDFTLNKINEYKTKKLAQGKVEE